MFKSKKFVDERIEKESNRLYEKMTYLIVALTVVALAVKMLLKFSFIVYSLEAISLIAGSVVFLFGEISKGILFVRKSDDALKDMHRAVMKNVFMTMFFVFIFGEFVLFCINPEYWRFLWSVLLLWLVPALIITIVSIKNGWMVWGTKKKEKTAKSALAKRTVVGALFFGIFVGWNMLFKDGVFQPTGILWILALAAGWGVPFYFIMVAMVSKGEKQADKGLKMVEKADEE